MHIIDQTEQRTISALQWMFFGVLSLVTLKKSESINRRLKQAQEDFKEASDRNRV